MLLLLFLVAFVGCICLQAVQKVGCCRQGSKKEEKQKKLEVKKKRERDFVLPRSYERSSRPETI